MLSARSVYEKSLLGEITQVFLARKCKGQLQGVHRTRNQLSVEEIFQKKNLRRLGKVKGEDLSKRSRII